MHISTCIFQLKKQIINKNSPSILECAVYYCTSHILYYCLYRAIDTVYCILYNIVYKDKTPYILYNSYYCTCRALNIVYCILHTILYVGQNTLYKLGLSCAKLRENLNLSVLVGLVGLLY